MISAQQLQYGLVGMTICGSAAALAALLFASSSGVVGAVEPGLNSPYRAEVETLLRTYQRAWHPDDRAKVAESGRDAAGNYGPVLRSILLRPWHDLAGPAVELAAAWGVTPALPELRGLAAAGPSPLRAAAVRAVDVLEPWPVEGLLELVRDPDAAVQGAAFEVAFRRDDAPWRDLVSLMVDAAPPVREVAAAALPTTLPDEAVAALADACDRLHPDDLAGLLNVLAKGFTDERTERLVVRLVGDPDPAVGVAALGALANKPAPLRDADAVWQIAEDPTRSDLLRTAALRCLERTDSADPAQVRYASDLPPRARYFAARCLLKAGDLEGVEVLVALVEDRPDVDVPGPAGDDTGARDAAQASRRLLAWLTGVRPGAPAGDFRDWLVARPDGPLAIGPLPPAPF